MEVKNTVVSVSANEEEAKDLEDTTSRKVRVEKKTRKMRKVESMLEKGYAGKPQSKREILRQRRKKEKALQTFKENIKYWQKPSITYAMSMCKEILEILMGTTITSAMSRTYMERLKVRILEHYLEMMTRRVKMREEKEYKRAKHLILTGQLPFSQAPEEMNDHIVIILENYCNELIEKRRAHYNLIKPKIPTYLYWDDTPDPPFRLSIEVGHKFRSKEECLCKDIDHFLYEDLTDYMFDEQELKRLKYADINIRKLAHLTIVSQIYDFADIIMQKDLPEMGYKPKSQMVVIEDTDSIFTVVYEDDEEDDEEEEHEEA
ncbi:unnamed protein product [Brassicogethes aeneus]|uniref:Uncharacterized protein n=1 Tax=Brassicogethes aeneus TaxID=1431903 RepID=A0A9P0FLC3_BRAAE|nr:unnamed protein product [Brassicogethes aeneus]